MLVKVSAALPVLESVTGVDALVVLIVWLPKAAGVERLATGVGAVVPVPESVTLCGLPAALSVTERDPVRVPVAVGVNVTLIVQLAAAARGEEQLLVCAKSPLVAMLVKVSAALPVLESVTGFAALVVLIV